MMGDECRPLGAPDLEGKAPLDQSEVDGIRAAVEVRQGEMVALDQVVDRNGPLMLLVGAAAPERGFVERDGDQMVAFRHVPSASSGQAQNRPPAVSR